MFNYLLLILFSIALNAAEHFEIHKINLQGDCVERKTLLLPGDELLVFNNRQHWVNSYSIEKYDYNGNNKAMHEFPLSLDAESIKPCVSPDGLQLAYFDTYDKKIYILNTRELKELYSFDVEYIKGAFAEAKFLSFSDDNNKINFIGHFRLDTFEPIVYQWDLRKLDVPSKKEPISADAIALNSDCTKFLELSIRDSIMLEKVVYDKQWKTLIGLSSLSNQICFLKPLEYLTVKEDIGLIKDIVISEDGKQLVALSKHEETATQLPTKQLTIWDVNKDTLTKKFQIPIINTAYDELAMSGGKIAFISGKPNDYRANVYHLH